MNRIIYDLIPNVGSFLNNYDYNNYINISREFNKYSLIHLYKNERVENTTKYKMKRVCVEIEEKIDTLPLLINEDEVIDEEHTIDYRHYMFIRNE